MATRLINYFIVVGFDPEGQQQRRHIIQRYPDRDWTDSPFIDGIELFCQPQGWKLSRENRPPTFFSSVLTDIDANRHYCACLCFTEPVAIQPIKQPDDEDLFAEDGLDMFDDGASGGNGHSTSPTTMYAPKCLVIISPHYQIEKFKNFLSTIYTVYIDSLDIAMETLVGNLLCIEMPPAGGLPVRVSLGANDRQLIHPPQSPTVPVTGVSVYRLFEQLGIHNVVTLFCAVMTEQKILFHSKSYTRLHDACHALTSLMYPFKYSHVYIPLLPAPLLEVLSTPTPFVMAVHSSLKDEVAELLDVIVVDLDGGWLSDNVQIPKLDEATHSDLVAQLCAVLRPQLEQADFAFPSSQTGPSAPPMLDKEIRAIFVRFFAKLLQGYRSCLQIVRIHPKPFITFHKAAFLGLRNLVESDFVVRLLECMFFNSFIQERGLPYRPCDLFDELHATVGEMIKKEARAPELVLQHVRELASQLHLNESLGANHQSVSQKVPQPTEGAHKRIHQPLFPQIKAEKVNEIVESERIQREMTRRASSASQLIKPQIVPSGPLLIASGDFNSSLLIANSARRLELMRNCVNFIFDGKILDARKTFPAVLRALKNKSARLALAQELQFHVTGNKAVLEHEQFDLVVRLMNCALQQDSDALSGTASGIGGHGDVNGVAARMMPLAMAFCRKLCTGVMQFAYTCLQEHQIWSNQNFWEAVFYQDVEKDIRKLYLNGFNQQHQQTTKRPLSLGPAAATASGATASLRTGSTASADEQAALTLEVTALDVTADRLRMAEQKQLNENQMAEALTNEESTLFAKAIHFANSIVALKVPLDIGKHEQQAKAGLVGSSGEAHSDTNSHTGPAGPGRESVRDDRERADAEREAIDTESGFEEDRSGSNGKRLGVTTSEIGSDVIKFVSRFVDKVCTEGEVSEDQLKNIHQMIPMIVAMQIDMLDSVYRESKKLPPITKTKIVQPYLLPGEELLMQGLRVFLLPDGRDDSVGTGANNSGPNTNIVTGSGSLLLPAEGAIFLTNYRVIFRGRPCDPFYFESPVVRSFPIATLTREKRISFPSNYLISAIDHYIQEGLQLRSSIFQLIRIAFDEEVPSESVEGFRKLVNRERAPADIFSLFAFSSQTTTCSLQPYLISKKKGKNATLGRFAKKTLMKTAGAVGLPVKDKYKKSKYLAPPGQPNQNNSGSTRTINSVSPPDSLEDKLSDSMSISSESHVHSATTLPAGQVQPGVASPSSKDKDPKSIAKLLELGYVKDFIRLELGSNRDVPLNEKSQGFPSVISSSKLSKQTSISKALSFRISLLNITYETTKSYPAFLPIPVAVNDDSIRKLSRYYKHSRFPVVVWRHRDSEALLLRGSSFHGKGVIGILRGGAASGAGTSSGETSASVEQEKYFKSIINLTRSHFIKPTNDIVSNGIASLSVNNTSALSLDSVGSDKVSDITDPGTRPKKHGFTRAVNTLRSSGGKGAIGTLSHSMGKQFHKITQNKYYHGKRGSDAGLTADHRLSVTSATAQRQSKQLSHSSASSVKISLHVFVEKSQVKGIKVDQFPNCEFIPVDIHDIKAVRQSYKKLLRTCCPSASSNDPDQTFFAQLEKTEWLPQLQAIMRIASAIVDYIDLHSSSVMVCIESGWDMTPQITSIAQICLDPYYRTFAGFRVLIEKEWLAFGHRFSHRSNHTAATLTSGFAPIFLQFLDIVHQIMNQFPLSFEFNHYYLRFIAYHYLSCRFRTFMLECEQERSLYGWLHDDLKKNFDADDDFDYENDDVSSTTSGGQHTPGLTGTLTPANAQSNTLGTSFWDHAERIWSKSSLFYNFHYVASFHDTNVVLRPYYTMANLTVWDFYLEEELAHGYSYDLELIAKEKQRIEEIEATDQGSSKAKSSRRILNANYQSVTHFQPNHISKLLDNIRSCESQLCNYQVQNWKNIWSKTEIPHLSETSLASSSRKDELDKTRIQLPNYSRASSGRGLSNLFKKALK